MAAGSVFSLAPAKAVLEKVARLRVAEAVEKKSTRNAQRTSPRAQGPMSPIYSRSIT